MDIPDHGVRLALQERLGLMELENSLHEMAEQTERIVAGASPELEIGVKPDGRTARSLIGAAKDRPKIYSSSRIHKLPSLQLVRSQTLMPKWATTDRRPPRKRSGVPGLDGITNFVVAVKLDTSTKARRAAFAVQAVTEPLNHGIELGSGNRGKLPLGQFRLQAAQLIREGPEALGPGSKRALLEILPLDGAEVLDEMLMGLTPIDEGAFSDPEPSGNLAKANALRTQLDKLLNRFLIFHNL
jgi:hypothetical protein